MALELLQICVGGVIFWILVAAMVPTAPVERSGGFELRGYRRVATWTHSEERTAGSVALRA